MIVARYAKCINALMRCLKYDLNMMSGRGLVPSTILVTAILEYVDERINGCVAIRGTRSALLMHMSYSSGRLPGGVRGDNALVYKPKVRDDSPH